MKNFLRIFSALAVLLLTGAAHAQNVGINSTGTAPNTSAILDVSATNKGVLVPQVSLTSLTDAVTIATPATSLLVYNTNAALTGGVGYYYNSGTSAAPVWSQFNSNATLLGQSVTDYYSTGGITVGPLTAFTAIPGFPVTITVPANTAVLVTGNIGLQTSSAAANGFSTVDVVIALDGALLANGGYDRVTIANNGGLTNQIRYGSFSVSLPNLTPGTHTLAFYSAGTGGASANATVGGTNATVLQATMSVTMIRK